MKIALINAFRCINLGEHLLSFSTEYFVFPPEIKENKDYNIKYYDFPRGSVVG
jgi:hypothetical protein